MLPKESLMVFLIVTSTFTRVNSPFTVVISPFTVVISPITEVYRSTVVEHNKKIENNLVRG